MEKVIFDTVECVAGHVDRHRVKCTKVSLNERMAVVEYDPATVAVSDIAKVVNDLGYIATARRNQIKIPA